MQQQNFRPRRPNASLAQVLVQYFFVGIALATPGAAAAADADDVPAEPNDAVVGAAAKAEQAEQPDAIDAVVIPLIAYTPETSLLFSGIGMLFSGNRDAADQWRTTLAGVYTLKNQILLTAHYGVRLNEDRLRLGVGASVANWLEEFYGIGPGVSLKSENLETLRATVDLHALGRIADTPLFVGLLQETEFRDTDAPAGGSLEQYRRDDLGVSRRVGLGVRTLYDTRDSQTGTRTGTFVSAEALLFQKWWGSSNSYARLGVDARRFVALGDHVLAGQALIEARLGDAPYYDLGELGGANLLRGIYEGRYRDARMAAAQAEYRSPLIFWRISAVAFGGVGVVGPTFDEFALDQIEWAGGGGLRILLLEKRNLNLRLDYAASADESGFYLSIGEAF